LKKDTTDLKQTDLTMLSEQFSASVCKLQNVKQKTIVKEKRKREAETESQVCKREGEKSFIGRENKGMGEEINRERKRNKEREENPKPQLT